MPIHVQVEEGDLWKLNDVGDFLQVVHRFQNDAIPCTHKVHSCAYIVCVYICSYAHAHNMCMQSTSVLRELHILLGEIFYYLHVCKIMHSS